MSAKNIIIVVVLLLLAAGFGFWYWSAREAAPPAPPGVYSPEKAAGGLGANIFEKSQNPISDKLPETNPFGADINPFEKEANPLKAQYKNPFEPR